MLNVDSLEWCIENEMECREFFKAMKDKFNLEFLDFPQRIELEIIENWRNEKNG